MTTQRELELEAEIVRLREALVESCMEVESCLDEDPKKTLSNLKDSEVMRQRAISAGSAINPIYGAGAAIDAIRALPNVTLEDLK